MTQKIEQVRGDTFEADVVVRDKTGQPIPLTGVTITWKIALAASPMTPLLTKGVGDGVTVADADAGKLSLKLTAAETGNLVADEYFHTIRFAFADGRVKTGLRAYFSIVETL